MHKYTYFHSELINRRKNICREMTAQGFEACVFSTAVNMFYLHGQVINGYFYISENNPPLLFAKRPVGLSGENVFYIRKPEQIAEIFVEKDIKLPETLMLETDELSYNDVNRLLHVFNPKKIGNATALARKTRSIKTPYELDLLRISAQKHSETYKKIPSLYRKGMTDIELSIELERVIRQEGSIGVFRSFGQDMDIFVGSILAGENAAAPSPFDFALGGSGIHPSVPIGANNTVLKDGMTVMVDMGGTFTGYITDMTRTYSIGKIPDKAYKAHQISIDIHHAIREIAKPGVICENLYYLGLEMARKHGLEANFMGIQQQAKFIGHGIGIEVNELPVLAPRFNTPLEKHMVFALEPKFVLPEIGAVGIENSYIVTENGLETLTVFEENIIPLK